mmetsp:Transcript_17141/g.36793  ORF Transcript_17141/g.36793 Transcript_17141/m.36793 type:complete len:1424 (-) Transcript_17141:213-4484(-)
MIGNFEYVGPEGRRKSIDRKMAERIDDILGLADEYEASEPARSRVGRRAAKREDRQLHQPRRRRQGRHQPGRPTPGKTTSPDISALPDKEPTSVATFAPKKWIQQGRHAKQRLEPSEASIRREQKKHPEIEEEHSESNSDSEEASVDSTVAPVAESNSDGEISAEELTRAEFVWGWMAKTKDSRWGSGKSKGDLHHKLVRKYLAKFRTECKIHCQDEKAEEKMDGLARPLRKGILMSPWEWKLHRQEKYHYPLKHTLDFLKKSRTTPKGPAVVSVPFRKTTLRQRERAFLNDDREKRYRRMREEWEHQRHYRKVVLPGKVKEHRAEVQKLLANMPKSRAQREKEEREKKEEEERKKKENEEEEKKEDCKEGQSSNDANSSGAKSDNQKGAKGWAVKPKFPSNAVPPPEALDWTEEDTAELSKMASEEAQKCVAADGTLRLPRLRMLLRTAQPRLLKQVLGRFPPAVLATVASQAGDLAVPKEFLQSFLTGDVINSALIAEQNRCRLAWMKRPAPHDECDLDAEGCIPPPPPIGQPLSSTKVCIFGDYHDKVKIEKRPLDVDEIQHPRTEPYQQQGLPVMVESLAMFRTLLACFTYGISEDLPFHKGIVVGGSACFAALHVLPAPFAKHKPVLEEIAASFESFGTTTKVLFDALGRRGGARNVAIKIMSFLKLSQEDIVAKLDPISMELFGPQSFYNSADLDLFVVADSKAGAADALEETFQIVHTAMRKRFDVAKVRCGASAASAAATSMGAASSSTASPTDPVIVKTPNSITLCGAAPLRNTQLVCKLAEDVNEMLSFADLPCTALAYDGQRLWATKMAHLSLSLGYNLMSNTQLMGRAADLCQRIAKYCLRGCGVMVYELCRHEPRCDVKISVDIRRRLDRIRHFTACASGGTIRWSDRTATTSAGEEDYDTLDLPRASKRTLQDFLTSLGTKSDRNFEETAIEEKIEQGKNFWAEKLEWRREKLPQVRRKFGLDAEDRRCYMCSVDIPNAARPKNEDDAPSRRLILCCAKCNAINKARAEDSEDLSGYTAVVTGGRCKIGYEACLMLLRAGAFVVTSTRFPRCAAKRFAAEKDVEEWADRLHIYGVDFSDFPSLRGLADQLVAHYPVDILINNAAQTIRRPPAYYSSLFSEELDIYEYGLKVGDKDFNPVRELNSDPWKDVPNVGGSSAGLATKALGLVLAAGSNPMAVPPGLRSAAAAIMPRDESEREELACEEMRKYFPGGRTDLHGEQLDLRPTTTWSQTLATSMRTGGVSHRELLEVLAVNAAAPFILVQALLPLLTSRETRSKKNKTTPFKGRFVVNVTSAEGIFSPDGASSKGAEHPHSNMAKAALNMLTKTIDGELAGLGVYCTAVDPGWVSMMRPGDQDSIFRPLPPLTEIDGAARVVAPIFDGLRALQTEPLGSVEPPHGVLLKNFEVIEW